jgi:hypothetical protein
VKPETLARLQEERKKAHKGKATLTAIGKARDKNHIRKKMPSQIKPPIEHLPEKLKEDIKPLLIQPEKAVFPSGFTRPDPKKKKEIKKEIDYEKLRQAAEKLTFKLPRQ